MGEVTSLARHDRLISFFLIQNKQHLPSVSCVAVKTRCWEVGVATHSNVYDSDPEWGQAPPLHHILVVGAAVVCRVGLPAVLEVVGEHVVPVVLLLWAVGERHWPVGLELLQRRVVKGHQVLLGAGQQLLLLVSVILGLLAEEKGKWILNDWVS